jgi:hypothetical protein
MGMPVAVGQGQFDLQQGPPPILCVCRLDTQVRRQGRAQRRWLSLAVVVWDRAVNGHVRHLLRAVVLSCS